MKITEIRLGTVSVPLHVPFKTALRTVTSVENLIVEVHTDTGHVGYGEAAPNYAVTGETHGAVMGAVRDYIAKTLVGRSVDDLEDLLQTLNSCIVHNNTAKAAVDMALYDLYGQLYRIPTYKQLGGSRSRIVTDITISVNDPEEMARDARTAIERGYDTLKIKVGANPELDLARLSAVRREVGPQVQLRIDANQVWKPKQAVRLLNQMQDKGLDIELVEQPVPGPDFEGLRYVTENAWVPVMADESVFSPQDAVRLMQMRAVDYVNIKLMKCGGLYNALKITTAAEIYGVECMVGGMLETKIATTAGVHLACARKVVSKIDLDGPVLCSEDPVHGGAVFAEKDITLGSAPGLGITGVDGMRYLD